jgi:hypothetical protein
VRLYVRPVARSRSSSVDFATRVHHLQEFPARTRPGFEPGHRDLQQSDGRCPTCRRPLGLRLGPCASPWRVAAHLRRVAGAKKQANLQVFFLWRDPDSNGDTTIFQQLGGPFGPTCRRPLGLRLGLCARPWRVAAHLGRVASARKPANLQEPSAMARPGLEPGTPRFSGSRLAATLPGKGLQIDLVATGRPRRNAFGFGFFGARLGLCVRVEVPMSWGGTAPSELVGSVCDARVADGSRVGVSSARITRARTGDTEEKGVHRRTSRGQAFEDNSVAIRSKAIAASVLTDIEVRHARERKRPPVSVPVSEGFGLGHTSRTLATGCITAGRRVA